MLPRIDPTDIEMPRSGMLMPSYPNAMPPAMSPATRISTVASAGVERGDDQLRGEQAGATDRSGQQEPQVAPAGLARDRVAREQAEDDDEEELAHHPQRRDRHEQTRTATRGRRSGRRHRGRRRRRHRRR